MTSLPSLAHLSQSHEASVDFMNEDGHIVASLRRRANGHMALLGVRKEGFVQMSAPLEGSYCVARVEYGGQEGVCPTPRGLLYTRLFLRSAHNRGHATVLVRNGYMIGRIHMSS